MCLLVLREVQAVGGGILGSSVTPALNAESLKIVIFLSTHYTVYPYNCHHIYFVLACENLLKWRLNKKEKISVCLYVWNQLRAPTEIIECLLIQQDLTSISII